MPAEKVETLIIGGGQAGLAMSAQLSKRGLPHVILERHRIVERWRTERWDGLHANGPARTDRLVDVAFPNLEPDAFATRDQIVDYFVAYADAIAAPIRCGVAVTALHQHGDGFLAQTSQGPIEAANVVAATGPFQRSAHPMIVPPESGILQLHAGGYRNPGQLPEGAVLVVGAGASGAQIADELLRAGRRVYLSVGGHIRAPRRYRGHDLAVWMELLGMWAAPTTDPPTRHISMAISGAFGGETIDFRRMASRGLSLLGRTAAYRDGTLHFAPDLADTLAKGDAAYLAFLDAIDAYAQREGHHEPADLDARITGPESHWITDPVLDLNLDDVGITTIVWATGYALDFGWLHVPVLDDHGQPIHRRGVTAVPGLYFLGLSWLSRRASAFICGLDHDTSHLANHIAARKV